MKISILTLAFAAVMLVVPQSLAAPQEAPEALPAQAAPIFLRESVVVSGKLVRIGDLFANVKENAETPVAYAPEPGKRAFFDANWLYRVARAYKLNWKPLSVQVRVVVERDSIVIKREEIEDHILAALIESGVGMDENMSVEVSNHMLRFYVAGDSSATLAVEDISYEQRTMRFTAIIAVPANDPAAPRMRVTGRVYKVSETPVMVRRMLAGEVIARRDIVMIKVRDKRLQNNVILNAEDLIGKAPRRSLRAGTPIHASDVRRPILVPRGSLVTMILRLPDMVLTAKGKALDEGSDGDAVRVVNTQSNTVIDAVVIRTGVVTVRPNGQIAMN